MRSRIFCGAVRSCEDLEPLPLQQKPRVKLMNGRAYAGNISGRQEACPEAHFTSCAGIRFSLGGKKKQPVPAGAREVPTSPGEPTRSLA